jgi:hypothetical protein
VNRALYSRSGFPLGLPAGRSDGAAIPLLSIPLEDPSDRPANVGIEPPCDGPTKGESKKGKRRKLNEIGGSLQIPAQSRFFLRKSQRRTETSENYQQYELVDFHFILSTLKMNLRFTQMTNTNRATLAQPLNMRLAKRFMRGM